MLYALLCALVLLVIARAMMRRSQTTLGLVLGLPPMGAMEAAFHLPLRASVRGCLERACLSAGCDRIEFGCTEWSWPSQFLSWAAGLAALVFYAIGAVILAVPESQRPVSENAWARVDPPQEGLRAG